MAKAIARDGEGATCLIEVRVTGAHNELAARQIAKTIAGSSLVKAAIFGRDPNWGRIAAAAGRAGVTFEQENLKIQLGDFLLFAQGQPLAFDKAAASAYLKQAAGYSFPEGLTATDNSNDLSGDRTKIAPQRLDNPVTYLCERGEWFWNGKGLGL